jgi:response regulator RpfG family c-di-GMP phosphodiesterase
MATADKLKILFVDDEENVLRSLKRLFMDGEYHVLTSTSGRQGLDILKVNEVAVVVSDQRMPQMNGTEFLEHVKKVSPDTVRILLTAHADAEAAVDAINRGGAYLYITKPWNNDDFLVSVRSAAERYSLGKENKHLTELTRQQNEELKNWNSKLKTYVRQQTADLTNKNQEVIEMNEKLKVNFRDFMVTISNLIELENTTVANHSNNVAVISKKIAQKIGLDGRETQNVAIAAQLHDVGKIGISETILLKDVGSLSSFESEEYRKHPVRGQAVLDSNETLRDAGGLIRSHHESMNGKGFPDGLKGENIPLGSRIVSIVDRYDRLVRKHSAEQALDEVGRSTPHCFDPDLYDVLEAVLKENTVQCLFIDQAVERELHPDEILPGMRLSRGVRSGTGLLLLGEGSILTPKKIGSVKRYYLIDAPDTGVFVWLEGKGNR